ncbi:MAG: DUF4870 domain-containing protein [Ignavibacteria bacterium]|nr:DUF4870 domain-containing protein [Ignavibacteria bacterium]
MTNSFGTPPDPNSLQGDEKMLALFSHLSLFLGGIILPVIFWATNRDKSKFVTFHSLQALWFHLAYIALIIVWVLLFVVIAIVGGVGIGMFSHAAGSKEMPVIFMIMMAAFYLMLFAIIFGAIGYSIYMGVKSYQGNLVKYPIIGKKVFAKVYGAGV